MGNPKTNYKNATELKSVRTRIGKARAEWEVLEKEKKELYLKLDAKRDEINKLKQIEKDILKEEEANSDPIITEHAVLRYIERMMELDLDGITKVILPDKTKELIKQLGDGTYTVDGKYKAVVKNNAVVTIKGLK